MDLEAATTDLHTSDGGRRGLVAVISVAFITTYLFGSANVALPYIRTELHSSPAAGAMVMGGYAVTFATLQIWFGRLGDNVGRHHLLRWGLAGIVLTSVAVGAANSITALIVLRMVQGIAVAAAAPQLLSTIQATRHGAARARAIAGFSAAAGLGSGAGVVLGGALGQLNLGGLTWRPVMWSPAVVAGVAWWLSRHVAPTAAANRQRHDLTGTALLTAALVALVGALSLGPTLAWPWWTLALLVLAIGGLALFWRVEHRWEQRGGSPLVPPSVVRLPTVAAGLVMTGLFFGGYGAFTYEWAAHTQQALGSQVLQSGLGLGGFCLAFFLGSLALGRVQERLGNLTMAVGGLLQLLALAGIVVVGVLAPAEVWILAQQPPTVLLGIAQAWQFGPLVQTVMAGVPDRAAGLTGGLVSTAQQAALAVGVAVIGGAFFAVSGSVSPASGWAVGIGLQAIGTAGFIALAIWMRRRLATHPASRPVARGEVAVSMTTSHS
ncbi:MAG: MFS transporter [Propionibacteriales bacterium]|nr:MFS transporter [Propionibacteriales bacterium]